MDIITLTDRVGTGVTTGRNVLSARPRTTSPLKGIGSEPTCPKWALTAVRTGLRVTRVENLEAEKGFQPFEQHVEVMGGYAADDIFDTRWGSRPGSPPE